MSETHTRAGAVRLKNVAAFMAMTERLVTRGPHMPGFAVFNGPSGYGKSVASIFAQNKTKATRVEVGFSWTARTFLQAVLKEFGETFAKRLSVAELSARCIEALGSDPTRPLIIDEADKLVDKGFIELARELQEFSSAPVILVGEERLPAKLVAVERVHNRVLDWCAAQPCDLEDARLLADNFVKQDISVADDLLDLLRAQSGGRARRIVVNLMQVEEFARNRRLKTVDASVWGAKPFYTGEPPVPRPVEQFKPRRVAA